MKILSKKLLSSLFLLLTLMVSTVSQANISVEHLNDAEKNFVINVFNAFLSIPKSCSPMAYPKYGSAGSFVQWDDNVNSVAEMEALDLAEDDSLDVPAYQDLLGALDLGYSFTEPMEVTHISHIGDIFQLLSVNVLSDSAICKDLMRAHYNAGRLGLSKVKKEILGQAPQHYWVLIITKSERLSNNPKTTHPGSLLFKAPDSPLAKTLAPIYTLTPISSQSDNIRNSLIVTQSPVRQPDMHNKESDLVITDFEAIGNPRRMPRTSSYKVAIRVVMENQGNREASAFSIGARQGNDLSQAIPLTVVGQRNTWKPLVSTTLFPGESISVEGRIIFKRNKSSSRSVNLYAVVDDCNDSLSRDTCDVNEINENNNISKRLVVKF